jgi:PAS domain S-box-containing protein
MLEDFYRTKQPPWGNPLQETSFQRPDGSLAVVQSGIFPIQLEGSFLACGIIRDVTERKLIEQEREQQAEHRIRELEAVFAAMTDSIIVYDVDGSPVYANPAFHAMYGLDPIGMERGSLVDKIAMRHQDGRLLSGDEIPSTRALRGETVQDMPILFADTRGKQHYKLTSAAPFIVDGKLSGAVVASHDITDHIQAEREVRQARDEMATLLNISQNIVSTLELQPLLDMILEELASVVSYTTASIITFEQDQASIRSYRGMRQSQEMRTISFSLDRIPLLQQAIDNQREFYIADGRHLPDLMLAVQAEINQPLDTITRYRTWFGVPLVVKGRPIGLLLLLHTEPDYYSSSVRGLVRAFALQAAIAIENARLYQEAGKAAALAERSRLAGELHDAVSQTLFSASLIAEVLPVVWGENPGSALKALNELRELTRGALAEMRTLLAELRPAYLTEKPLGELVSTLVHTASHRGGIPITISLRCDSPLPPDVQIAIYRIAQEALNNILKHAKASRAEVMLGCMDGQVQLQIQDNGCGFDPEIVAPEQRGMGTMRERARGIGAELDIWSQPGEGTKITVRWSAA